MQVLSKCSSRWSANFSEPWITSLGGRNAIALSIHNLGQALGPRCIAVGDQAPEFFADVNGQVVEAAEDKWQEQPFISYVDSSGALRWLCPFKINKNIG